MADNQQPQFALQRIYIKDASFEAPNAPQAFTKEWKPEIKLDLNSGARKLDDNHYEVSVKVTVTATNDGETAFLVELVQAGLFAMVNIPEQQLKPMLGAMCPNILFPYLRESIDSLVVKGGFPALMLAPINFDALFQQRMQQEAQQAQAESAEQETTH
ncbi:MULTISPECIES: protein-export chaperone SecB [Oceanospirillaceae]|jgi:preprotein translocase subunit SecB|uniref:protein-export chaperone SecB n=1 Tax=Oceanospirillaceae TaxID=135620 RepID=UPI000C4CFE30|nr:MULTISPECIES: protein-export chaperone SecB [Thalassolituus]MAY15299.1 protein-export chaperone SecB [Oceanospirillaceae bacterium]PIQ40729.1 MAG: protein-export chaperone SecB [Thalassolituus sp. CG17_big_fil_post_rev_8_21_14_2_50_53_8]MCA6060190.1 protein-export chaperone SecB [Thalassolituus sp. ST750PaO-4]MCB2388523.1 protein-export chaperone SecB [Thalassolituus alkanivorans]MCB2423759.1 protein-export chaperone SecB [Thalassolituus alkanivorans]|tara:strand:- start:138 stop:611 length:474 start_codon:yes stop_codon:yes gene_type:complete